MRCAALVSAALFATTAKAADYAVLAATSKSYANYRHQADIAHAYQVLTKGGVPAENIITFMYDDVANNRENPFPGKLFNQPTAAGVPGVDVYGGVKIDYRKRDVTSKNFLSVLTGDAAAMQGKGTGRVLTSGKNDRVFVNVVDHGAPGMVAFPGAFSRLYKEDLMTALKTMQSKGMYKQLVFYLEACESGSMFADLPADMNIYATTAANAQESSWGTYCGNDAHVDGKNLDTCLGDLYSVNWMQNADKMNLAKETLQTQYTDVKAATNKSHVMQFGEMSMAQLPAGDFEGVESRNVSVQTGPTDIGAVDSRDAALSMLFSRYLRAAGAARDAAAANLVAEIDARQAADKLFADIAAKVAPAADLTAPLALVHRQCHKAADAAVAQHCGGYSDYSLKHVRTMINVCEAVGGDSQRVVSAIEAVCGQP
eukprot:TRINITY_DN274_c0_g1_i2.p2 TRINITY_DN274_c0_g1~~TRINITY_DN274_c0_g1_i2.p2  ORF type:complete len:450 (+),score=187.27 TRINITY_DN274_c0_g1_i2:70-1350(+)